MTPSAGQHQQYEAYAAAMLRTEEALSRRAIRLSFRDPLTGELAKSEAAHQPFDLATASAENQVIQGAQGYRIAIYMLSLYNSGDPVDVTLKDGVGGTNLSGPLIAFPQNAGYVLAYQDAPIFTLSPGNSFVIATGAAAAVRVTGFLKYRLLERGNS